MGKASEKLGMLFNHQTSVHMPLLVVSTTTLASRWLVLSLQQIVYLGKFFSNLNIPGRASERQFDAFNNLIRRSLTVDGLTSTTFASR